MAKINAKKMTEVNKFAVPFETLELLSSLKDMPHWDALKIVMKTYIDNRMHVAYNLDEKDPNFAVMHAKESAQALAYKFLIRFVEKEVRRLSEEEEHA